MELSAEEVMKIRRYLLGEVTEQDREQIEVRLLTDPQYSDQLVRGEDELTDQYVRGDLNRDELELFENYFMSAPERRDEVAFTLSLHRYVSSKAIGRTDTIPNSAWTAFRYGLSPRWRITRNAALACAGLLLTVALGWLLMENARLQRRLEEIGAERQELRRSLDEQRSRGEDLARQLEISRNRLARVDRELAGVLKDAVEPERTEVGMVTLALIPGLGRDTADNIQTRTAILPAGARRLRLELGTDHSGYTRYRAEVQTADGDLVWSRDALTERSTRIGKAVLVTLPVALLTKNSYLVTLSGAAAGDNYERIGTYYFDIKKK